MRPTLRALCNGHRRSYVEPMPDTPPQSPFTLTRARIILLALGALALITILAALSGGLSNYQLVKQGATEQTSSQPPSQ